MCVHDAVHLFKVLSYVKYEFKFFPVLKFLTNQCSGRVYKNEKIVKQRSYSNDKKNDVNVNNLPTENSNTIVSTTAVLKVTMFYCKQPVQKLPMKESLFLRKLEFHLIQVVREVTL